METQELVNRLSDMEDAIRYALTSAGEIKQMVAGTNDARVSVATVQESEPQQQSQPSTPTLEEVRSVLADLSRKGYTDAVRELLHKYGANKLSAVDPASYNALLTDAKEICHD